MTTPRAAIGLSERLRFDAARCEIHFSKGVASNIEEGATALDALQGEISQWANEVARYKAYAEKFDEENAALQARVKELEAADRYANLISIIADIREKSGLGGYPMLSELADAIGSKLAEAEFIC